MNALFSWRAFAFGLVASTVGAGWLGWYASGNNDFADFSRFFRDITPESLYFPTARQVAGLVDSVEDPRKILVIAGGTSVFRGVGQSNAELWTRTLQNDLGSGYTVLNLAMDGAGCIGLASFMVERLVKEQHEKVIYSCDLPPGPWEPDSRIPEYRYLYFDSWARGYLLENPQRDAYFWQNMDDKRRELRIQSYVNLLTNSQELWSWIGYRFIFTVYSSLTPYEFWWPRRYGKDQAYDPDVRFRFRQAPAAEQGRALAGIQKRARSGLPLLDSVEQLEIGLPAKVRDRMIAAVTGEAPFYVGRLSEADHRSYDDMTDGLVNAIVRAGIVPAPIYRELTDDDHWDGRHLNGHGGAALAHYIAPLIRAKAKQLGFQP